VLDLSTRWYDRFLKDEPNGIDKEKPVQVASDPWRRAVSFAKPPAVKGLVVVARGTHSMTARGKIVYTFPPLQRTVEQFGAPVVTVEASTPTEWPHLVAVVTAGSDVLTEGGTLTPLGRTARSVKFRLISDANLLKRGTRLRLYFGATSTVQNIANLLYLKTLPDDARLKIRSVSLTVPVLAKTISR
jgi:predicted acyl esterase